MHYIAPGSHLNNARAPEFGRLFRKPPQTRAMIERL